MQRLLFINSCLTSGGSERVMALLANEFAQRDYDVTMVLLREKKDTYIINEKIKLIRFHYTLDFKPYIIIKRLYMLHKELKNPQYDLAISFMYDINIVSLLCKLGSNIPILISERADPNSRFHGRLYKAFENKLYLTSKYLILQTERVKTYYSKELQAKSIVIPNPISDNLPEEYHGEREKKIVAVGRITEQKNFSLLIEAFSKVYSYHPDYYLEIYGDGPLRKKLETQSKQLGLHNSIFFKGYVKDILNEIKTASMYVSSSNFEGISNAMLEAMALGIPTICTDCPVGGAAMIIQNEKNGLLIPTKNKPALINAMNRIIEEPSLAKKIGENASKIKELYSIKRIADKWELLFK